MMNSFRLVNERSVDDLDLSVNGSLLRVSTTPT